MFEYIKGKIIDVDTSRAVIDVNGIGYKVFIPSSIYSDLIDKNETFLYITYIVKEESQTLYGFLSKVQRNVFELLLTVSGIGPKTGILLLGHLDIDNLQIAVTNADIRLISKVPGIGKKTAERLVLELRDKLKTIDTQNITTGSSKASSITADAIAALMNLGYNPSKAQIAVKSVLKELDDKINLSDLITKALNVI